MGKHVPELDGIRRLAILLIIALHYFVLEGAEVLPRKLYVVAQFGWTGVDLFFVLSGFLIGGILLDVRESTNYFKVFYVRRFYRIVPVYLALCALSLIVFYPKLSTHDWLFEGKIPWYAYLTFGQNFWMTTRQALSSRQIDATWSLAIEEQFYLTLPLVIWLVRDRYLPYVLTAGIAAAPFIRMALWWRYGQWAYVASYVLAPCRMDALLLGVLGAWWVRNRVLNKDVLEAAAVVLAIGFAAMIRFHVTPFELAAFGYTLIAMFYLAVLLLAVTGGWVGGIFRSKPLLYLGTVAYGLYLFHQPVLGLVYAALGRATAAIRTWTDVAATGLAAVLVLGLARLSWRCFEKPMVKLGHRFTYSKVRRVQIQDTRHLTR